MLGLCECMKTADKKGTICDSVIRSTMLFSNIFKVHFLRKKYCYAPTVQSQTPFPSEKECCCGRDSYGKFVTVHWCSELCVKIENK